MQYIGDDPAYIEAIRANPDDDGLRLIYADFLDESSDPMIQARAELIRLQLALDRIRPSTLQYKDLLNRQKELLLKYHREWTKPLRGWVAGFEFRRGILDSISIDVNQFLKRGEQILQLAPIRRIRFLDVGNNLAALAESPLLLDVPELDFCGADLGSGNLQIFLNSPNLRNLQHLDLSFNGLCDNALALVAKCEGLRHLRALCLNDNQTLSYLGMEKFSEAVQLGELRELDISGNAMDANALRYLALSPYLSSLQELRIHANPLGDSAMTAFASSDLLCRCLKNRGVLDLRQTQLGPQGLQAFLSSPHVSLIRELDLGGNRIGDEGIEALVNVVPMPNLRHLGLRQNQISDSAAVLLSKSVLMQQLDSLDLSSNLLSQVGIDALWSRRKNYRTTLEVSDNLPRIERRFRNSS